MLAETSKNNREHWLLRLRRSGLCPLCGGHAPSKAGPSQRPREVDGKASSMSYALAARLHEAFDATASVLRTTASTDAQQHRNEPRFTTELTRRHQPGGTPQQNQRNLSQSHKQLARNCRLEVVQAKSGVLIEGKTMFATKTFNSRRS